MATFEGTSTNPDDDYSDDISITKDDNFIVAQYASPSILGSGVGDDTYLISSSMLPSGVSITITDVLGSNSIQLADGLSIASSQVANNALQLTLDNGSEITVLGADDFTYEAGGNSTAGINNTDANFNSFVQNTLGTTVPGSGVNSGGSQLIGTTALPGMSVASASDNFIVAQYASPSILGSGVGDDTYLISSSMLPSGTSITITDVLGSNSIQLAPGLNIASSQVANNALQLTLDNGSEITVLGADDFTYEAGGNSTAGINNVDVSFNAFVQNTLGTTVPDSGVNSGGSVEIGSGGSPALSTTCDIDSLGGTLPCAATFDAATDSFTFVDSMTTASNVEISNFCSDDLVEIHDLPQGQPYSISNDGTDVVLGFTDVASGATNIIVLLGVVDASSLVYDRASLEDAIGFDVLSFA